MPESLKDLSKTYEMIFANLHGVQVPRVGMHQVRPPEVSVADLEQAGAVSGANHLGAILVQQLDEALDMLLAHVFEGHVVDYEAC